MSCTQTTEPRPTVAGMLSPDRCRGWRYVRGTLTKRPCYAKATKESIPSYFSDPPGWHPDDTLCDDCRAHGRVKVEGPAIKVDA